MTELSGVMRFKRHFAVLVVACVALRGAPFAIRREL